MNPSKYVHKSPSPTRIRFFNIFSCLPQGQIDDHGVFKTLAKLWQHNAHLAVFMNFVMSNCDPASLFFHLITDLYKEGTAKDMKKWAYEIHSTYLVPNAVTFTGSCWATTRIITHSFFLAAFETEQCRRTRPARNRRRLTSRH